MKGIAWGLVVTLAFLLTACAATSEDRRMHALYERFDKHCREHALDFAAEVDEEERYRECMSYFFNSDVHCPDCVIVDPHLSGGEK